jgi:hypothetical protein
MYVNGDLETELAGTGNIHSSTAQPLFLGCRYGTQDYFRGLLDEVRIYSKALTASQINQSYYQTMNLLPSYLPATIQLASASLTYLSTILALSLIYAVLLLSKTRRKSKLNRFSLHISYCITRAKQYHV